MTDNLSSYANAMYEVSKSSGKTTEWILELKQLADAIATGLVTNYVNDPSVSRVDKASKFTLWLDKANYPAEIKRFVEYLVLNNKLSSLGDIVKKMRFLDDELKDIKRLEVIAAMEMPDAYKQKIAIWLDKKYTSKVELSWQIDSELIAGFMVKDGDTVFDYSVRNKIEQLKKLF